MSVLMNDYINYTIHFIYDLTFLAIYSCIFTLHCRKEARVMPRLANIAYHVINKIGMFQNQSEYYCHNIHPHVGRKFSIGGKSMNGFMRVQTGTVRVNCVDCLDRTNTAQFALGKAALAFQVSLNRFLLILQPFI